MAPITIKVEKGASTWEVGYSQEESGRVKKEMVVSMPVEDAKEAPVSAACFEKIAPILSKVKVEKEAASVKVIKCKDENSNPQPRNKTKENDPPPTKNKTPSMKTEPAPKRQKKEATNKHPTDEENGRNKCRCGNCDELLEICGRARDKATSDLKTYQYRVNARNCRYRRYFYKHVSRRSAQCSKDNVPKCVLMFARKLYPRK